MRFYVSLLGCATCAFSYNNVAISRLSSAHRGSRSNTSNSSRERSSTAVQLGSSGGGGRRSKLSSGIVPGRNGEARDGAASRAEDNAAAAAAAAAGARGQKDSKLSSKNTSKDSRDTSSSSSRRSSISVADKNMISFTSVVQQTAAAAVGALVDTDAAHALLTPLHGWLASKRRVAEAIKAEQLSADAEKAEQQRQLSEEAWKSLLQEKTPRPISDTYNALAAVAAAPAKLVESVGQTAEDIAATPAKVKKVAEEAVVAGKATAEVLASLPRRAQEAAEAAEGLSERAGRAFADGVGVYERWRARAEALPSESRRLVDAGKVKLTEASEAAEVLPSRSVLLHIHTWYRYIVSVVGVFV